MAQPGTRCTSCFCSEVQLVLQVMVSSHLHWYALKGLGGSALFSYTESSFHAIFLDIPIFSTAVGVNG